jgi:hypothetical protein
MPVAVENDIDCQWPSTLIPGYLSPKLVVQTVQTAGQPACRQANTITGGSKLPKFEIELISLK